MFRRVAIAVVLGALLVATTAPAAEAPTRHEYVKRLERICKPDALATQRLMREVREEIRAERLSAAARRFAKATAIFGGTVKKMAPIPRPPADRNRLAKWFTYLKRQEFYLRQITSQLRRGHAIKAQRLTARFIHNGNLANNVVLAFGMNYCSFKFSRYG